MWRGNWQTIYQYCFLSSWEVSLYSVVQICFFMQMLYQRFQLIVSLRFDIISLFPYIWLLVNNLSDQWHSAHKTLLQYSGHAYFSCFSREGRWYLNLVYVPIILYLIILVVLFKRVVFFSKSIKCSYTEISGGTYVNF